MDGSQFRRKWAVAASATLIIGMLGAVGIAAATPNEPPRPEWVRSDGTVDMNKVPDQLPAVDEEGRVIGQVEIPQRPPEPPGAVLDGKQPSKPQRPNLKEGH